MSCRFLLRLLNIGKKCSTWEIKASANYKNSTLLLALASEVSRHERNSFMILIHSHQCTCCDGTERSTVGNKKFIARPKKFSFVVFSVKCWVHKVFQFQELSLFDGLRKEEITDATWDILIKIWSHMRACTKRFDSSLMKNALEQHSVVHDWHTKTSRQILKLLEVCCTCLNCHLRENVVVGKLCATMSLRKSREWCGWSWNWHIRISMKHSLKLL